MASPKVTKNNVTQTINLNEEMDFSFHGKTALKDKIGQEIIDTIRSRVAKGKGLKFRGDSGVASEIDLKGYSEEYKNSLKYKAFNKDGTVNMKLTGDMLNLMDFKVKGNKLEIGWNDSTEKKKAYAHMVGSQGDSKVTMPKREFFGISKDEIKAIQNKFKDVLKKDGES